jgi:hypothetical protein
MVTIELRRPSSSKWKFGRVMSDPAMRERCLALKYGESATADIAEGLQVMVTRLEGDELGCHFVNVIWCDGWF